MANKDIFVCFALENNIPHSEGTFVHLRYTSWSACKKQILNEMSCVYSNKIKYVKIKYRYKRDKNHNVNTVVLKHLNEALMFFDEVNIE